MHVERREGQSDFVLFLFLLEFSTTGCRPVKVMKDCYETTWATASPSIMQRKLSTGQSNDRVTSFIVSICTVVQNFLFRYVLSVTGQDSTEVATCWGPH